MNVGIISGYFDPLHGGHIEYIVKAKSLCDSLVCIVNNDKQALAKNGHVFLNQDTRVSIMCNLQSIDFVFLSIDEDCTVCKSIEHLVKSNPNDWTYVFLKGGDRFAIEIPESKICKELGIEIVDGLGDKIDNSSRIRDEVRNGTH